MAQAVNYASPPSMGESKNSISRKRVTWNKFINSFDTDKVQGKKIVKTVKEAKQLFGSLGIPVIEANKDVKKNAN